MCGIAGYLSRQGSEGDASELLTMARTLRHRGPDDEGFVLVNTRSDSHLNLCGAESDKRLQPQYQRIEDRLGGFPHDLGIAHRRYSIVDLSVDGHQPMWDVDECVCVSFYGEIYNYVELRAELEEQGARFRTHSDTEVILQSYLHWGTGAFARFNGPFALVIYDRRTRALLLCRDPLGKASFYYTVKNDRLYWATEIKAFLNIYGVSGFTIKDQAVHDFVYHDLRDFDGTFWNEIHDFPPASFAWVQPDLSLKTECYWLLPQTRWRAEDLDLRETIGEFESLLTDAIRIRLRADVPVAFELSGGMDSSSLVALAAAKLPTAVTTFTVKHHEEEWDEEPFARKLSARYQDRIDYRVLVPEKEDFWVAADDFCWIVEEPFHSPNVQTNQHLRRLMKQAGFRAVITGSAGDEVLAGYAGDYDIPFLNYLLRRGRLFSFFNEMAKNSERTLLGAAMSFVAKSFLPHPLVVTLYKRKYKIDQYCREIYHRQSGVHDRFRRRASFAETMAENMGAWKMNYWLRVGPKSMFGIPLEPRSPFLDCRLVDFAFKLPPEYLIHEGWHKWILRQTTDDILPNEVVWRRHKMGFPFPIREWLQHSKDVVETNLSGVDCPYLSSGKLMESYDDLAIHSPYLLWRFISLTLWWKKIVLGDAIVPAQRPAANLRYAAL